ncbi:MAG: ATP-binding cassette domain-containing protein [Frankiaceae bacterium]|nr:ATP-binding cassette domain-containing protein [Frankiaceae bacterium]
MQDGQPADAPPSSRQRRSTSSRLLSRPELLLLGALTCGLLLLPDGLPPGIAALGVVTGSILGLNALGIVLLYRTTKVLNFAQIALGAAAAVLFYEWIMHNEIAVLTNLVCESCVPDIGVGRSLQRNPDQLAAVLRAESPLLIGLNLVIGVVIALVISVRTGHDVNTLTRRLMRSKAALVPTMALLALGFAMTSGAAAIPIANEFSVFGWHPFSWWFFRDGDGPEGRFSPPYTDAFEFGVGGDARFHLYDAVAVLACILAAIAVAAYFRFGKAGLLARAVADNPERAASLGVDVRRQVSRAWLLAGLLSGTAALLTLVRSGVPPGASIDVNDLTLILAGVVFARLTSPSLAVVASLLLGILDQGMFWNFGAHVQFQGCLVLLVGAALLLQRGRQTRAELAAQTWTGQGRLADLDPAVKRLPAVRGLLRWALLLSSGGVVAYPLLASPGQLSLGITAVSYTIIGLSLLVLTGWAGQVSLGQFAFAAVGGYVASIVAAQLSLPLPLALLVGAVAGAIVSPLIGLPALRLPGPFVVITTLAFSLAVAAVLLNRDLLGSALPKSLPRPLLLGLDLADDRTFYYFSLAVLAVAIFLVVGLHRSRMRRTLIAARDNAAAAESFGVPVMRLRLEGFAAAGFIAALGGGLLAYATRGVETNSYSATLSVLIFLAVLIGGLAAPIGPLLGGAFFALLQLLGQTWFVFGIGAGAFAILLLAPAGLSGALIAARNAAVRILLHLQGIAGPGAGSSGPVPIAALTERGGVPFVPTEYRLTGAGYGPVEGTRLPPAGGASTALPSARPTDDVAGTGAEPLLAGTRLDVRYGSSQALFDVDLALHPGEILAIVGTNGAGKTTLLRAIAGLHPVHSGRLTFDGEDITTASTDDLARRGIALVPGGAGVLPTLTVADNLRLALWSVGDGEAAARIAPLLERFGQLRDRLTTMAGNLSGGEQQLLALCQAIAQEPRVLLVDELSLGLSPQALADVLDLIRDLADRGTAVVLVEQSISTAIDAADTAVFLDNGAVRYAGPARDLRAHPELFASVAFGAGGGTGALGGGSEFAGRRSSGMGAARDVVLEATALVAGYGGVVAVNDVSFAVTAGEVLGILGPNGAGKTSLFDAISGTLPLTSGQLTLLDNDIVKRAPHGRAALGLMRSYQNVRLFPSLTVAECITVALETRLKTRNAVAAALWLPTSRAEERRSAERVALLVELLELQNVADRPVGSLSLGTRRIVDLACQLAARPKVLLLDEPSSGLAQAETDSLGPLVSRISKDLDCAVLIIEHDIGLLATITDRILAMNFGSVIAVGEPRDVLQNPAVRAAYFGSAVDDDPDQSARDRNDTLVSAR